VRNFGSTALEIGRGTGYKSPPDQTPQPPDSLKTDSLIQFPSVVNMTLLVVAPRFGIVWRSMKSVPAEGAVER